MKRFLTGLLVLPLLLLGSFAPSSGQNKALPAPQGNHFTFAPQTAKNVMNLGRFRSNWTVTPLRPFIASWLFPYALSAQENQKLFTNAGFTHIERAELVSKLNVPNSKRFLMLTDANLMLQANAYAQTLPASDPGRAVLAQYAANRQVTPGYAPLWFSYGRWIYGQFFGGGGIDLIGFDIEVFTNTSTAVAHEFAREINRGMLTEIISRGHPTKIFQYGSSLAQPANYNTAGDDADRHLRQAGEDWFGTGGIDLNANPLVTLYRTSGRINYLGRDQYARSTWDDRSLWQKDAQGNIVVQNGQPQYVRAVKGTTTVSNYGVANYVYTHEAKYWLEMWYSEAEKIYADWRWLCNAPNGYNGTPTPGTIPYPNGTGDIRPGLENIRLCGWYRDDTEQDDKWNPDLGQMETFGELSNRRKLNPRSTMFQCLWRGVLYHANILWSDKGYKDFVPGARYFQNGTELPALSLGQQETMIAANYRAKNFPRLFQWMDAGLIDFVIPKRFILGKNTAVGEREVDKPLVWVLKKKNAREVFALWAFPAQDVNNPAHNRDITMWIELPSGVRSGSYKLTCKNRDTGFDGWKLPVGFEGARAQDFRFQFTGLLGQTFTWTGDLNVPFVGPNPTPPAYITAGGTTTTQNALALSLGTPACAGNTWSVSYNVTQGASLTPSAGYLDAETPTIVGIPLGTNLTLTASRQGTFRTASATAPACTTTTTVTTTTLACVEGESAGGGIPDLGSSGGFFAGFGVAGDNRSYTLTTPAAGTYTLVLVADKGTNANPRLDIGVNGAWAAPSLALSTQPGYATTRMELSLPAGNVTLNIGYVTGQSWIKLDKFCLLGGTTTGPPTSTTTTGGTGWVMPNTEQRWAGPQLFLNNAENSIVPDKLTLLNLAVQHGANMWSPSVHWRLIETAPGVYNWSVFDQMLAETASRNLKALIRFELSRDLTETNYQAFIPDSERQRDKDAFPNVWRNGINASFSSQLVLARQQAFVQACLNRIASLGYANRVFGVSFVMNGYYEAEYEGSSLRPGETPLPGQQYADFRLYDYSEPSRDAFITRMIAKYGTVAAANAAWGTSYGSWGEVSLPRPPSTGSSFWDWTSTAAKDFAFHRGASIGDWVTALTSTAKAVSSNIFVTSENGSLHDPQSVHARGSVLLPLFTPTVDGRKNNDTPDYPHMLSSAIAGIGGKKRLNEVFTGGKSLTENYSVAEMMQHANGAFNAGDFCVVFAGTVPGESSAAGSAWPDYLGRMTQVWQQTATLLQQPVSTPHPDTFSVNASTLVTGNSWWGFGAGSPRSLYETQATGKPRLKVAIVNDL